MIRGGRGRSLRLRSDRRRRSRTTPPDLINVALEMLVKASLELPSFSTVDELASRVRREVNTGIFERVAGRIALPDRVGLESLLDLVGPAVKTPFNRLKQPAGKASWSGFRERSSIFGGSTPWVTPGRGWRGSRSRRSPTSPGRR
jgi:hypothetical protein